MKTKLALVFGLLAFTFSVLAGDLVGIGVIIVDRTTKTEPLRTDLVYSGSPAERAGIKPNWYLISVNGTNIVSMPIAQSLNIVRGPIGTSVTLELADPARTRTNKYTLKRMRMVPAGVGDDAKMEFKDK